MDQSKPHYTDLHRQRKAAESGPVRPSVGDSISLAASDLSTDGWWRVLQLWRKRHLRLGGSDRPEKRGLSIVVLRSGTHSPSPPSSRCLWLPNPCPNPLTVIDGFALADVTGIGHGQHAANRGR